MNTIRINGVTITGGRSISVSNGRVIVDGKDVTGEEAKTINIAVHGDISDLSVDACDVASITGMVGKVKPQSGDVRCGDVSGSVQTMSGDVSCGAVAGDVSTMSGDILQR